MGNLFKRGYETTREEKKRLDKIKENSGKKLYPFFLSKDGEEAEVRFLTEEPVNCYVHSVKESNGKFSNYVCTSDDCPLCADGDRPTYKGVYLIVDKREVEYEDSNGKTQTRKNQVRLYMQGMKVVSQLDRISSKYGLSNRNVNIVRLGTGTSTTYTIEKGDEEKLSVKEIEELLPDKLRDQYDGTMDSLMSIVEEQLMMMTKDYSFEDSTDDDTDDVEEDTPSRSKIVNIEDEDDEDEEEKPVKKSAKMFKRAQNSVKPRAKNILKG